MPHETSDNLWRAIVRASALFLLLAGFAFLCLNRFHHIHGQDEISHYMKLSRLLFTDGFAHPDELATFSPHLYPLLSCAVAALFGSINSFTLRTTGLLAWLATLLMVCWLTRRSRPVLALSCAVTLPCAVVATTLIDIDQAVLPCFTLLLVWGVHAWLERPADLPRWRLALLAAAVSVSYALTLWCRLSTPLILAPLLVAYSLLRTRRWQSAVGMGALLTAGLIVFLLTWHLYCRRTGICPDGPFDYLMASFQETTAGRRSATLGKLALNALYTLLWGLNPYAVLLTTLALRQLLHDWWHSGRNRLQPCLFLLAGLYLLTAYCLVGGALFGFPKYQMPGFPLLVVGLAQFAAHHWQRQLLHLHRGRLAAFAIGAFLIALLAGDQLLTLRTTLRDAIVDGDSTAPALTAFISHLAVTHLALATAIVFLLRRRLLPPVPTLIAASLALNLALLLHQSTAPYSCGYLYGDTGDTRNVAAFINDNLIDPERSLLPVEVLHELPRLDLAHRPPLLLDDLEAIRTTIRATSPEAIAISHLVFPAESVRRFLEDPELGRLLGSQYRRTGIGRYWLWHRLKTTPLR